MHPRGHFSIQIWQLPSSSFSQFITNIFFNYSLLATSRLHPPRSRPLSLEDTLHLYDHRYQRNRCECRYLLCGDQVALMHHHGDDAHYSLRRTTLGTTFKCPFLRRSFYRRSNKKTKKTQGSILDVRFTVRILKICQRVSFLLQ